MVVLTSQKVYVTRFSIQKNVVSDLDDDSFKDESRDTCRRSGNIVGNGTGLVKGIYILYDRGLECLRVVLDFKTVTLSFVLYVIKQDINLLYRIVLKLLNR